jgi:hypothetical protein
MLPQGASMKSNKIHPLSSVMSYQTCRRLWNFRLCKALCLGLTLLMLAASSAWAVGFSYTRIPNYGLASVGYAGGNYSLNNSGQVAFTAAFPGQYDQIFLFNNGAVNQLTNTPTLGNYSPRINDNGQIVCYADGGIKNNLYLYKAIGSPILVAGYYLTGSYAYNKKEPNVNNLGQIIFLGQPAGNGGVIDIYSYNSTTQQLINFSQSVDFSGVNHNIYESQFNDAGMIVWNGSDFANDQWSQIYRHIPGSGGYNLVSDNINAYERIKINNKGQFIAIRSTYDNYFNNSLMLYDNSSFRVLYQDPSDRANLVIDSAQINNNGQVAWCTYVGQYSQIFLYSGGTIKQLTNNTFNSLSPQINDAGMVVWATLGSGPMGITSDIYFYDGSSATMLKNPNSTQVNIVPMMNNLAQVLYLGYGGILGSSGGLYLATPNFAAPVANFTANPFSGPAPLTVQFTDTSTWSHQQSSLGLR